MSVIKSAEVSFTETTGAGVYTGSVSVPAGATITDIIISAIALWTATTSATLKVGDAGVDNRFYTGVDLKATDLLGGETLSFDGPGGKQGADLDAPAAGAQQRNLYSAAARVISGIVTTVGAAGNAGRTRMTVQYTTTGSGVVAAATKA